MSGASTCNPPDCIAGVYNFPEGLRVVITHPNYLIAGLNKKALDVEVHILDAEGLAEHSSSLDRMIKSMEEHLPGDPIIDTYRQNAQTAEDAKLTLQSASINPQSFPAWNDDALSVGKIVKNIYPEYDPAARVKKDLWEAQVDHGFAEGSFEYNQQRIKRYEERIAELAAFYAPAFS